MPIEPNQPYTRTQPLPPPPPPPPKPVNPDVRRAAATGRLAPDGSALGGARGSSRLGLDAPRAATERLSPALADAREKSAIAHDLDKLQTQAKGLAKPTELHALAQAAFDLAAQAENAGAPNAPQAAAFAARLDKADNAVEKLAGVGKALDTPGVERTSAIADALANPGAFKEALKDLGPLKDAPLLAHQKARVDDITAKATASALGKQLENAADLSLYPAGFAANLGKLRDVKDPTLQKGLDHVGETLLSESQTARTYEGPPEHTPINPLSLAALREEPGLGKLIAPLSESKNTEVKAQAQGVAQSLTEASLQEAVGQGGSAGLADAFKKPFDDLGAKTGLGPAMQAALPAAAEQVAKERLASGVSLEDVKDNAALGQLLGTLQTSKDPAVQTQLSTMVDGWLKGSLEKSLADQAKRGDPAGAAAATMKTFIDDAKAAAETTGLGDLIQARLPEAQKQVALGIAKNGDLKLDAFKKNPAYAQVLSTLNADPATKGLADDKVKALAEESVEANLDGKEGEGGVKDAMEGVKADLVALGQAGLGPNVQAKAEEAIKNKEDRISDTIDKGKSLWDRFTGAIEGVLGDIGDFVGDVVKGVGDVVGDVAGTVAGGVVDLVGGNGDAVKDAVNHGIDDFSEGAADSLDSTISSMGHALLHPLDTAKAFGNMLMHPVDTAKAIWKEASKGGIMHALGYGLTTVATSIYGGQVGSAALGKGLEVLGKGADVLKGSSIGLVSKVGTAAQWSVGKLEGLRTLGGRMGDIETRAGELGTGLTSGLGGLSTATGFVSSMKEPATKVLDTLAKTPGAVKDAATYLRTHGLKDTARALEHNAEELLGKVAPTLTTIGSEIRGLPGDLKAFFSKYSDAERALMPEGAKLAPIARTKIGITRAQKLAESFGGTQLSKAVTLGSNSFMIANYPGLFLGKTLQTLVERGGLATSSKLAAAAGKATYGAARRVAIGSYDQREEAARLARLDKLTGDVPPRGPNQPR